MIERYRRFALAHPIWFSLSLIGVYSLLSTLTYPVHFAFPETEAGQLFGDAVSKTLIFACFVWLLWRFGWLSRSGITNLRLGPVWLMVFGILVYKGLSELYAFTGSLIPAFPTIDAAWAERASLLTGSLVEETMYRGLVLVAMLGAWGSTRAGVVKSVIASSILFGLIHLFNLIVDPSVTVLYQAFVVSLPGVLLAALVLFSRSLWPGILIHAISNILVNDKIRMIPGYQLTPSVWLTWLLTLLPLVALAAYLIGRRLEPSRQASVEATGQAILDEA